MNSNDFSIRIQKYSNLLDILLGCELLAFNVERFQDSLPQQGGVYCISEKKNDALKRVYVGQSKDLQNRIYKNHLTGSRRNSTLRRKIIQDGISSNEDEVTNYLHELCVVQFMIIEDELDKTSFEHFAISMLRPKFND